MRVSALLGSASDHYLRDCVEGLVHADSDLDPLAGVSPGLELFEDCLLESEIERGGFGSVWKAFQPKLQRPIAVKILAPASPSDRDVDHLLEARVLVEVEHRFIADVLATGVYHYQEMIYPWIAMKYIERKGSPAPNVLTFIRKENPTQTERLALFDNILEGVMFAHSRDVLHGDLKPGNILIDDHDNPKIVDFGSATHPREVSGGRVAGTVPYMAPERFVASEPSAGWDVYALGVLLDGILSETTPFPSSPGPSTRLPKDLEHVLTRAKAPNTETRYATVSCLRHDLHAYRTHRPIDIRRAEWGYRTSLFLFRTRWVIAMLALVACLGIFFVNRELDWQREAKASKRTISELTLERDSMLRAFLERTRELFEKDLEGLSPSARETVRKIEAEWATALPQPRAHSEYQLARFNRERDAALASEDPEVALFFLRRTLNRLKNYQSTDSNEKWSLDYANLLVRTGDVYRLRDDFASARESYEIALTFGEQRLEGRPQEQALPDSRRNLPRRPGTSPPLCRRIYRSAVLLQ